MVGGALGMVPYHWAQLAGTGLQLTAKVGTAAVSRGRTEMYFRKVNKEYFEPRGLKASIASLEAMAEKLRLPSGAEVLAPLTEENLTSTPLERRLEGLRPYVADLEFDVPKPLPQLTVLAKLNARQVEKQMAKTEKKTLKDRKKQLGRGGTRTGRSEKEAEKNQGKYEKEIRKLDKEVERAERKAEREAKRRGGKDAHKAERELLREMKKNQHERVKLGEKLKKKSGDEGNERKPSKKDKEVKQAKKVLWIVIENI